LFPKSVSRNVNNVDPDRAARSVPGHGQREGKDDQEGSVQHGIQMMDKTAMRHIPIGNVRGLITLPRPLAIVT
jgi:hypothetical protein